jgi:hypothetical protein
VCAPTILTPFADRGQVVESPICFRDGGTCVETIALSSLFFFLFSFTLSGTEVMDWSDESGPKWRICLTDSENSWPAKPSARGSSDDDFGLSRVGSTRRQRPEAAIPAPLPAPAPLPTSTFKRRTSLRPLAERKKEPKDLDETPSCLQGLVLQGESTRTFQFYASAKVPKFASGKDVFICEGLRYIKKGSKTWRTIARNMELSVRHSKVNVVFLLVADREFAGSSSSRTETSIYRAIISYGGDRAIYGSLCAGLQSQFCFLFCNCR